MSGKMLECDGCYKIMRSDNLKNHLQTCKELKKDVGGRDVGGVKETNSQTTTTKSETTGQIVGNMDCHRKKYNCQGCG